MYKLPILMYHSILLHKSDKGKHNIYVMQQALRKQLSYLKKHGYATITFKDIYENKITDFNKKVILTFDDGYEDNYLLLFPLLKEFNFTAVIFLVTRETYNKWGTEQGEPKKNLMTKEQIIEMDQYGIEFGGHTCHHPELNKMPIEVVLAEVKNCKEDIETLLNKKTISFAYPFGGINDQVKEAVKNSGFQYGISTKSGPIEFSEDPYRIRRIEVATRTTLWGFKRKVSGSYLTKKYILF
jgi:peptidoglycan/xylan/chitin deacetylase (PgdA/CDA1 family)